MKISYQSKTLPNDKKSNSVKLRNQNTNNDAKNQTQKQKNYWNSFKRSIYRKQYIWTGYRKTLHFIVFVLLQFLHILITYLWKKETRLNLKITL